MLFQRNSDLPWPDRRHRALLQPAHPRHDAPSHPLRRVCYTTRTTTTRRSSRSTSTKRSRSSSRASPVAAASRCAVGRTGTSIRCYSRDTVTRRAYTSSALAFICPSVPLFAMLDLAKTRHERVARAAGVAGQDREESGRQHAARGHDRQRARQGAPRAQGAAAADAAGGHTQRPVEASRRRLPADVSSCLRRVHSRGLGSRVLGLLCGTPVWTHCKLV